MNQNNCALGVLIICCEKKFHFVATTIKIDFNVNMFFLKTLENSIFTIY